MRRLFGSRRGRSMFMSLLCLVVAIFPAFHPVDTNDKVEVAFNGIASLGFQIVAAIFFVRGLR